jgi:hypothetical protein
MMCRKPLLPLLLFATLAYAPPSAAEPSQVTWEEDVKPVLDRRCVVCHSCYDAPCQLQFSSPDGADRGATKAVVYDGGRLKPMDPTRLFIDAKTTQEWRQRDFYSVLRTSGRYAAAPSLMERMLLLGRSHPLPKNEKLPKSVELGLDRTLSCAKDAEFDAYANTHPYGGMPYGLAPLADTDYATLVAWVRSGAPTPDTSHAVSKEAEASVAKWEAFLNGDSAKQRITSRYLYEHLFLAHLYFPDVAPGQYFRLVRSRTPSGQPIDEIASVRPYDSPGKAEFYYRLLPFRSTLVDKTHMPYALSDAKMARYRKLFLEPDWESEEVPSYDSKTSANAFVTFAGMPARGRYQFLLDDAHYFIMTFIKGPVCRGQVALNVIEDHFFVAFLDPDADLSITDPDYLRESRKWLKLPAENKNGLTPGSIWLKYLVEWRKYVHFRSEQYRAHDPNKLGPSLDDLWNGDGANDNALLTVFRHFDSATVVKGYVGEIPKTAWVVDYPIFERIYYDLVAGFDVFGNVVHQLSTRLYMDYLRMEGEDLFLSFLPPDAREPTRDLWYSGAAAQAKAFLENRLSNLDVGTRVAYTTSDQKTELIEKILGTMKRSVRGEPDALNRCSSPPCTRQGASPDQRHAEAELRKLASVNAPFVRRTPDLSMLRVRVDKTGTHDLAYTLIHNKAHVNVAFMFFESDRRDEASDTMTIVPGYLGSYPNFFFDVKLADISDFVAALRAVGSDEDFTKLVERYGVRRSSPRFWETADWHNAKIVRSEPVDAGLLDLNRYDDY